MFVKFNRTDAETYRYNELLTIVENYKENNILACAITYEAAKAEIEKRKDLLTSFSLN